MDGDERLVRVDSKDDDEGVDTDGEKIVPDEIVKGGLHDTCFESKDGFFAEGCRHGMSESKRL